MAAFSKTAPRTYQIILTQVEDETLSDVLATNPSRAKALIEDFLKESYTKSKMKKKNALMQGYVNADSSTQDLIDSILIP
jgi:hypothetical protein